MMRSLLFALSASLMLTNSGSVQAQATDEMLREGAYERIVSEWNDTLSLDANQAGLTYFSAYYTSSNEVLQAAAQSFTTLRPEADPDSLGVGLGDMRSIFNDMQVFPFLEGKERQELAERADAEVARLSKHPAPEVASYAAFHRVIIALLNEELDRAGILLEEATREHAETLKANRDWRLMADQIRLIYAKNIGDTVLPRRLFEEFSFENIEGSQFELGFLDSLTTGLLGGPDREMAEKVVAVLSDVLATHPDPGTRFRRTFFLARSVGESQHELSGLAKQLFVTAGRHASEEPGVTGEDLYSSARFELLGNPPEYRQALLSSALVEDGSIGPSDPFFGRLLSMLAEDEEKLGNIPTAGRVAQRAAQQPPSQEVVELLAEVAGMSDRDAFLRLDDESLSVSMDSDLAGELAVFKRLYELALVVDDVDISDRTIAVSVYANTLVELGEVTESDRIFAAYIDIVREIEKTDAEEAKLAYYSYQDHLSDIGKFSKAATIDRDIDRAETRMGLQNLAEQIQAQYDGSGFLNTFALRDATSQNLQDDLLAVAEIAEHRMTEIPADAGAKVAAVAVEAYFLLGKVGKIAAITDEALARIVASGDELPYLFDLTNALEDAAPELAEQLGALDKLVDDLNKQGSDTRALLDQNCSRLVSLPKSAATVGCPGGAHGVEQDGGFGELVVQDEPGPSAPQVPQTQSHDVLLRNVAEASDEERIPALQSLRDFVLRKQPKNTAALAEVDAGLAMAYSAANDPRAQEFAESAFKAYLANDLLNDGNLYRVIDLLPGAARAKISRLEALRPAFQDFAGLEPVEAWLDLNIACLAIYDPSVPLAEITAYLARSYANTELWKRDIPGCDPFIILPLLQTRLEKASHSELRRMAKDLGSISTWLIDITRADSEYNFRAHMIDVLVARAEGDLTRVEERLAALLTEPYRSNRFHGLFLQQLEDRKKTRAEGGRRLTELFATPAEVPLINSLVFDVEQAIRQLIGVVPAQDLLPWIEKHAQIRFDYDPITDTREWNLEDRDPEVLGAWSLEVASLCNDFASDPYLLDQVDCANLAMELAEMSFRDVVVGHRTARSPSDATPTLVLTHSEDAIDPGRLSAKLRTLVENWVDVGRLDDLDRAAIEVLASEEPFWDSSLLAAPVRAGHEATGDWLKKDEAIVLLTQDRATVIRLDNIRHVPLDVAIRQLVRNTQALRASNRQTALGPFEAVKLQSAWWLWQALFAPIEPELHGISHIWLQAPPVVQQIPFEALVSREPITTEWKVGDPSPGWFIERFSVSVLPSLSSISGLQATSRSAGSKALLGLGAPKLLGTGVNLRSVESLMSGTEVDPQKIASLNPLEDAATELEKLSDAVGVTSSTVHIGQDLTHTKMSQIAWDDYKTVVFATHGLVASQPDTAVRALLALSPGAPGEPAHLTPDDIRGFDLDADLVILAACDIGLIDDPASEFGLSAFSSSFLESGARTVVVSKWPLVSDEAWRFSVPLTTSTEPGRVARTLREVRLELAQSGDEVLGHPAFWASMTVVGDIPVGD